MPHLRTNTPARLCHFGVRACEKTTCHSSDGPRDRVHARRPATPRPPRETRPDDDAARCRRPSGDRGDPRLSPTLGRGNPVRRTEDPDHDPVRPGKPAQLQERHTGGRRAGIAGVVAGPLRHAGPARRRARRPTGSTRIASRSRARCGCCGAGCRSAIRPTCPRSSGGIGTCSGKSAGRRSSPAGIESTPAW